MGTSKNYCASRLLRCVPKKSSCISKDEVGNRFNTRIEGTRIKHSMGAISIKMYDKFSLVLRIETTVNDVSFFKHYRKVEQKNGTSSLQWAPMKKGIYSLAPLQECLLAANKRYIDFISELDDNTTGTHRLNKVSKTIIEKEHSYKGFNFFDEKDQHLFEIVARGEFAISGFKNKNLRNKIPNTSGNQMSRILKRLRTHGLIKKIGHTYKYYLTSLGQHVIAAGLKIKNLFLIPLLNQQLPATL
ncbi:MAG: MarR family transcriptional regulator [Deltaproteobacteria bacterium]|nr:MarR family transcriptional regulator [Deltaproteobacteria bacterium]